MESGSCSRYQGKHLDNIGVQHELLKHCYLLHNPSVPTIRTIPLTHPVDAHSPTHVTIYCRHISIPYSLQLSSANRFVPKATIRFSSPLGSWQRLVGREIIRARQCAEKNVDWASGAVLSVRTNAMTLDVTAHRVGPTVHLLGYKGVSEGLKPTAYTKFYCSACLCGILNAGTCTSGTIPPNFTNTITQVFTFLPTSPSG